LNVLKRFLKRLLSLFDKALDVIIWLHDCVLLYICLVWLLPLFGAVFFSWLFYDLKHFLQGRSGELFLYSLLGFPFWLRLCLFAEFSPAPLARRIKKWLENAPARVGYVFLGGAGILWLFGVIYIRDTL